MTKPNSTFAAIQMPIKGLIAVGAQIREILGDPDNYGHIETAISSGTTLRLVVSQWDDGADIVMVRRDPGEPIEAFYADLGLATDTYRETQGALTLVLDVGTHTRSLV